MKSKYILISALVACLVGSPEAAAAFCFQRAGRTYDVPPMLIEAIAYQESSFDPQAIHHNHNGSFDYGLMQINSWWFDTLGAERWQALADPCFNVRVGAWILRDCFSRHGYTWDGLACYRSGKPLGQLSSSVQEDVILYIQRLKAYFNWKRQVRFSTVKTDRVNR